MFARFHKFETLEELLFEFLGSNGGGYTLAQMLSFPANDKVFCKFHHCKVPYLATIKMVRFPDKLQLRIKLPNNGFVYMPKEGPSLPGTPLSRHKSKSWICLPKTFQYFKRLIDITPQHTTASFFYDYKQECVDFLLKSKAASVPDIMVTYEHGFPYVDDDIRYSEAVR